MTKRKYTRIKYETPVRVLFDQGISEGTSKDLSLRGIQVKHQPGLELPVDTKIVLKVNQPDFKAEINGQIVFARDDAWGIKFTHISETSLKNLINVLKRASHDANLINTELNSMVLRVAE